MLIYFHKEAASFNQNLFPLKINSHLHFENILH